MPLTDLEWQAVAAQLRCPNGPEGTQIAERMQQHNFPMLQRALASLALAPGDRLLEIGPGNGAHLGHVLGLAPGLHYHGLDLSPDMVTAARQANAEWLAQGQAGFTLGDAHALPFANGQFNKALSVNTIYFWEGVPTALAEIARVLAPGGRLALAFIGQGFFEKQPFTRFGFAYPALATLAQWLQGCGLVPAAPAFFTDQLPQPPQTREFVVLTAQKG
jgi:ubiquinone/menaquinone biosynthesis C-methylase UbiE